MVVLPLFIMERKTNMNEEQMYGYMEELLYQIPNFIKQENVLKKHLLFMRFFADYEWFNIASILYVYPNATNVKTTEAWSRMFSKSLFPKKGQKGIPIMLPLFNRNKILQWKFVKVFDISQMATTIKPVFISPLKEEIEHYGLDKIKLHYGDGWQNEFFETAIEEHYFIREHPELKEFVLRCCLFAFGDVVGVSSDDVIQLQLSIEKENIFDYIGLYKCIKDIFSFLPEAFKTLTYQIADREKEKEDIQMVNEFRRMNIKQLKQKALSIVNDRLQYQADGGTMQEQESEEIDKEEPQEPTDKSMIFNGEIGDDENL